MGRAQMGRIVFAVVVLCAAPAWCVQVMSDSDATISQLGDSLGDSVSQELQKIAADEKADNFVPASNVSEPDCKHSPLGCNSSPAVMTAEGVEKKAMYVKEIHEYRKKNGLMAFDDHDADHLAETLVEVDMIMKKTPEEIAIEEAARNSTNPIELDDEKFEETKKIEKEKKEAAAAAALELQMEASQNALNRIREEKEADITIKNLQNSAVSKEIAAAIKVAKKAAQDAAESFQRQEKDPKVKEFEDEFKMHEDVTTKSDYPTSAAPRDEDTRLNAVFANVPSVEVTPVVGDAAAPAVAAPASPA